MAFYFQNNILFLLSNIYLVQKLLYAKKMHFALLFLNVDRPTNLNIDRKSVV